MSHETGYMNVSKEEAQTIVDMAKVCYDEGIGPNYDHLILRIVSQFGIDIYPIRVYEKDKA